MPEIRREYFLADDDGFYKTSLYLTDEEVVHYTGLLDEKPPERESLGIVAIQLSPEEEAELLWVSIRARRARLLAESDWVVTKAMDQGTAIPANWHAYRQALRDITDQTDPRNITWPVSP